MNQKELIKAGREALESIKQYLPYMEYEVLKENMNGEEGSFFAEKMIEMAQLISDMPKTYEQDGKGDDAVAYLHYFGGPGDWYITEKDMSGDGTQQAFGFAILGGDMMNAELGYIPISELVQYGVELDLYYTPKTLGEIKKDRAA